MPYGASDTPSGTGKLPAHARSVFRAAANASYAKYGAKDEGRAQAIAWLAVKRAGYSKGKGKDGKWIAGDGALTADAIKLAMRDWRQQARDAFDPDEPRDEGGKWSGGGGGSGPSRAAKTGRGGVFTKEAAKGFAKRIGTSAEAKTAIGQGEKNMLAAHGHNPAAEGGGTAKSAAKNMAKGAASIANRQAANEKKFPVGSLVTTIHGEAAHVTGHNAMMVETDKGEFHETKVWPVTTASTDITTPEYKANQAAEEKAMPWAERTAARRQGPEALAALNAKERKSEAEVKSWMGEHPFDVSHGGKTYYSTGKFGTDIKSGEPSAEYQYSGEHEDKDERVWRTKSGKIVEDAMPVSDRRSRKTKEYDPEGREKATFEEEEFDDAAPPIVSTPLVCVCDAAGGSDMMYDSITLDDDAKVRYTDDGFMVATPRVARVGIQVYRGSECNKADMDTVRIYRPPEEVFNSDAMRSLTHRPMTLDHPTKPVTVNNWREHAVGQTGDEVLRDGNAIRVPMVLMDAAAIGAFRTGKNQLSVGYDCDIDWTPGVTDGGEPYDAVQRNIKANHVAIVAAARGGPTLKIGDGTTIPETSTKETAMNLKTVLVDNFPCQMEDNAAMIVQRTIASLQDQIENFKKKFKAKEDDDDDAEEESTAKDAAIVKLDTAIKAKDAEIVTLKKQVTDAQAEMTADKLDARVVDRLGVISKAKAFLGDKWTAGGKNTQEIRKEVVAAKVGDAAKVWDDKQIEAAFVSLQVPTFSQNRQHDGARTPIDDAVLAFGRPGNGYTNLQDAKVEAYKAYDADLANAWRGESKAN